MTRLGALAHPPFARLLSGQLVSSAGTQMSITAGAWVLYRLTRSPLALGLQGLCFSAPIAVLPLLTGVLADRFSRLTLVKATLAAEAGQAFVLAAITTAGDLRPWMLYLAAAADACRLAVNIPAQSALVPNVVPAALLPSAMALSASVWSSAALAGPALAGALLTVTGPGLIFAINGACTLVALAAVASLPGAEPGRRPSHGTGLAQLTGGIAYLRGHRPIVWLEGILLIAMTGALGVETLLPVFSAGTWHTGPAGYGLLRMAPGIAAVLAGLGLSLFPAARRGTLYIAIAFAGAGAGWPRSRPVPRSRSPSSSSPARPCAWSSPRSSPAPWSSRPFPMRCGAGSAPSARPGRTGWPASPPPPRPAWRPPSARAGP